MRVLVIGGTGRVGALTVAALRARGVEAVPASRSAREGIALDMADSAALNAAAKGFDAAFLATPLGEDETKIGLGAVSALRAGGIGKLVYVAIQNLEAMQAIPHFAAKIPIKQAVLSDQRSTVIEPNFFFQNDLLFREVIVGAGVYPLPIGARGVFSVDVADIAEAAASALLDARWAGHAVPVCGAERLTGETLAANWSRALKRPVHYGGDAIEPFIAGLIHAMPHLDAWARRDFEIMMRVTQDMGCPATDEAHRLSAAIIGRAPRTHAEFVAATCA